jgi:PAS domain S-box-containing protein
MDRSVENAQQVLFWNEDPRVRGIVENVADGVIGIDIRGYIELFNPAAERLFGYSTGEVMGRNVSMLMPPGYGDHHDSYIDHYLQTGERRIIGAGREVTGQRRDGSTFPMYLSVGEIRLPGHPGFIGIVHDLSGQKAAEHKLASAGEFLQSIIDSMPSALVGVDGEGRVTHWSRVAAEEVGIGSDAAIGRPFTELFPFLDLQIEDILRAISAGTPVNKQRVPVPGGATTRYLDVMIYPLVHDTRGAVVRIDDVSERVRIEEMMVQTEKMMSVGGLAAGMAHEINNPLGIVAQGCQNVNRRVSTDIAENRAVAAELGIDLDKLREYLERRGIFRFLSGIQEAAARASRIVSDMLAYSRRSASSFVPVHLNELLDTVLRLAGHDYDLKESYDFRRITIRRETIGDSDRVYCDEMAIEQVFLNLLRNAAQAMAGSADAGSPEISLKVVDEGEQVCVEVADNGPGMSEEVSRRLFEPFFTTKPVGVGTGLGLSVAYFIVTEQHRGSMEAQSEPGGGAHFIVRLPREGRPYGTGGHGG